MNKVVYIRRLIISGYKIDKQQQEPGADSFPAEVNVLLGFAQECSLSKVQARERIGQIHDSLAGWKLVAQKNGVRKSEVSLMAESISPRLEGLLKVASSF